MENLRLNDSVWADTEHDYPIDEIICVTPDPNLNILAAWGDDMTLGVYVLPELQNQLFPNPIYIAREIEYWDIDKNIYTKQVRSLLSDDLHPIPRIRYLHLQNPKNPVVLESAAGLLKDEYLPKQKQYL